VAEPGDPRVLASPEYVALSVSAPVEEYVWAQVAVPDDERGTEEQMVAVPLVNVTVPVGLGPLVSGASTTTDAV
jgi:hypothetical protein